MHKMVRISLERFLCANVYASGEVTTVCGATTVKSTFLLFCRGEKGGADDGERASTAGIGREQREQQFHFNRD